MLIWLAGFALLLPGLFWWIWWGNRDKDPVEALAGVIGISVAFISLIALFFYLINLTFTPYLLGGLLGFFAAGCVVGVVRTKGAAFNWGWLVALLAFGLISCWRIWQARELLLPSWVDSLHHVLIVRKMIEVAGLPGSLEPYLPGPFYYHFAFHAVSAVFSASSQLEPAQAVLLLGQLINAGVSLSVYALVKTLTKDWRAAALAGLIVTFATKMPGYYLAWGRYTMLIGMLMLPLAMAEALRVYSKRNGAWRLVELGLLTSGVLLSHYVAAFLFAVYLVLLGLDWVFCAFRLKKWDWKAVLSVTLPVLVGLLAVAPWYLRVFENSAKANSLSITVPTNLENLAGQESQWEYLGYILGPITGYVLAGAALIGLVLVLSLPKLRHFGVWSLVLTLLALPIGLQIFSFRSDYFGLTLFVVIAALSATAFVGLADWIVKKIKHKALVWTAAGIVALTFLAVGGWYTHYSTHSDTVLVRQSDISALEWIEAHTPKDARFFVNTTPWGYNISRGVDGGTWLLPLTGRWSLAPTVFYAFGGDKETAALWRDWGNRAGYINSCSQEFWDLVEEAQLDYVYLREDVGSLKASALQGCPGLKLLYTGRGASVWLIERNE